MRYEAYVLGFYTLAHVKKNYSHLASVSLL